MSNTDNIDRFGHCVLCHRNMIYKKVVDGKVLEMFFPEHDHTDFILNNGSIMKVCCCKICKNSYDLNDPIIHEQIMEAVMKGWELETRILVADEKIPEWTQEHADKYLDNMSKLNIYCSSENLATSVIQDKQQIILNVIKEDKLKEDIVNAEIVEKAEVIDGIN